MFISQNVLNVINKVMGQQMGQQNNVNSITLTSLFI